MRRRGYTLIEWIVIACMFGLICAIVIPMVRKEVKKSAPATIPQAPTATKQTKPKVKPPEGPTLEEVLVSPAPVKRWRIEALSDNTFRVIDTVRAHTEISVLSQDDEGHPTPYLGFWVDNSWTRLLVLGEAGSLINLNLLSGEKKIMGIGTVKMVAISPDDTELVIAEAIPLGGDIARRENISIVSWKGEGRWYVGEDDDPVNSLTWSPDGKSFAAGGIHGSVRVWDRSHLNLVFTKELGDQKPLTVTFSDDGMQLTAITMSGRKHTWDVKSQK